MKEITMRMQTYNAIPAKYRRFDGTNYYALVNPHGWCLVRLSP